MIKITDFVTYDRTKLKDFLLKIPYTLWDSLSYTPDPDFGRQLGIYYTRQKGVIKKKKYSLIQILCIRYGPETAEISIYSMVNKHVAVLRYNYGEQILRPIECRSNWWKDTWRDAFTVDSLGEIDFLNET